MNCYTSHIELFVYLSEPTNYPESLNETKLTLIKPKHLPVQNTILLKYIPNYITLDEIYKELNQQASSIYNIEEMKGTMTGKSRHVRIELKSKLEYEKF